MCPKVLTVYTKHGEHYPGLWCSSLGRQVGLFPIQIKEDIDETDNNNNYSDVDNNNLSLERNLGCCAALLAERPDSFLSAAKCCC